MSGQKIYKRYSTAFKQKVVSEIESGKLTIADAKRIYDITGAPTIHKWIRKFGKNHLIGKVVRIEMRDEKDKIKALEKQIQQLESALAKAHVKLICQETLIECAEKEFQIDIKKKFGTRESLNQFGNLKKKK